jgi:hypothetical protein
MLPVTNLNGSLSGKQFHASDNSTFRLRCSKFLQETDGTQQLRVSTAL